MNAVNKRIIYLLCFLLGHVSLQAQHKLHLVVHDKSFIPRQDIYVAGSFNNWDSTFNKAYKLTRENGNTHSITLTLADGEYTYKFTGGNWRSVEKTGLGDETGDHRVDLQKDLTVEYEIPQWRDLMIPSSKLMLQQATTDTARLKALAALTIIYSADPLTLKPDSTKYYMQAALQILDKIKNVQNTDDWRSYNLWLIVIKNQYATLLRSMGNNAKALELRLDNIKVAESIEDTTTWMFALQLAAEDYIRMKDYAIALQYAQQELELARTYHPEDSAACFYCLAVASNLIAQSQFNLHSIEESHAMAKTALAYISKAGDTYNRSSTLYLLGQIWLAKHNPDSALYYFRRALSFSKISHHYSIIIQSLKGIGQVYQETGMPDSALMYVKSAFASANSVRVQLQASGENAENYISEITPVLAALYYEKNQPDSAYKYLQMSVTLKDSLYNMEKIRQYQNLTFNETIRKQNEVQKLEEEKRRTEARLKTYGFILGIIILAIFAFFQYRNSKQKHASNLLLNKQKSELENTLDVLQNTQKQLIQSEKMASLGELTAGIAHEIQNPLNFVNNFSEVNAELIDEMNTELATGNVQQAKEIGNNIKENEEKIIFHGRRADAIVKSMLQHSRASSGKKELTDINALVDEYVRLAYHGLRAKDKSFNATINTEYDTGVGSIHVVPQDIGRVVLNIVMNAFYAVSAKASAAADGSTPQPPAPKSPEGDLPTEMINNTPTVTITTRKSKSPSGDLGAGGWGAEIRITDNGPGIPKNILDKIFQPFFTTKPTGQGTGLGLSLSYDIMKAHGGKLGVETKEGEGTTFILHLPIA